MRFLLPLPLLVIASFSTAQAQTQALLEAAPPVVAPLNADSVAAADSLRRLRYPTILDASIGSGNLPLGGDGETRSYLAGAVWQMLSVDKGGRFQAGLGVRVSYFDSRSGTYEQTERLGGSNGAVAPADAVIPERLSVQAPKLTTFNAALHLRVRVAGPVRIGCSIDLAGVSAGSTRLFTDAQTNGAPRVTRVNLLRGGSKDRGSLNSEFYVSADPTPRLSVRGGLSHVVNGFELHFADDYRVRYHKFGNLFFLGISYTL